MKILLGLTGSVASTLAPKMARALQALGDVEVIVSPHALPFFKPSDLPSGMKVWQDDDEWTWENENRQFDPLYPNDPKADGRPYRQDYHKNDPVLHIELGKQSSALVIAPISANKIAEMAHGLCPDLLTSTALAWDYCRPIVVAPACNTRMWRHPATRENMRTLRQWGVKEVEPQKKMLACGDEGVGAMANIEDIVWVVQEALRWKFPLGARSSCPGIPVSHHPGAFGFHRKHSHHTGVDLYCHNESNVFAVESGTVVGIENFTGASDGSDWWNETQAMLVEGPSGVVCYGEISPYYPFHVGSVVLKGQCIARVKQVLKEGKERPDIPGHRLSMLHLELYPHGTRVASKSWKLEEHGTMCRRPEDLMDPTAQLIAAEGAPSTRLTM